MEKVPMTGEGYQALDDELKRLKTTERPAVIGAKWPALTSVTRRLRCGCVKVRDDIPNRSGG